MTDTQKTLIYINEENVEEAKFMSRSFVNPAVRNRAYINALGAEIIKSYLASEGINVENLHNLHSISKILEQNDVADILLPNIHIDVRVVFDEQQIFVPKSHFEKEIVPDVYAVVKFSKDFKTADFLGYFSPDAIDKKIANKDYYFVPATQLIPSAAFVKYVKNFTGRAARYLTEEDMLRGRQLAVSLSDHNISKFEEKELLELLLLSDALRESILEFDNFETLAYNAAPEVLKDTETVSAAPVGTISDAEVADDIAGEDLEIDDLEEEIEEPEDLLGDDMLEDDTTLSAAETAEELPEEDLSEEMISEEDLVTDELPVEEPEEISAEEDLAEDEIPAYAKEDEEYTEPEVPPMAIEEPQVVHEVKIPTAKTDELSVDDILDRTIASIDKTPDSGANDVISGAGAVAGAIGGAAIAAGGVAAAGALAAETAAAGAVTEGIKDVTEGVAEVAENIADVAATADDVTETVEDIALTADDLAEAAVDAEEALPVSEDLVSGYDSAEETVEDVVSDVTDTVSELAETEETVEETQLAEHFDDPKNLEEIDKAESIASEVQNQVFEQETVDLQEMDVVPNDNYKEEDLDTLSDIDTMEPAAEVTNEDDFLELHGISESEVVDLPMNDYVINEDGSSPLDAYTPVDSVDESTLVEMPPLEDAIDSTLSIDDTISVIDEGAAAAAAEEMVDELAMAEDVEIPATSEAAETQETAEAPAEQSSDADSYSDFNIEDFEEFLDADEQASTQSEDNADSIAAGLPEDAPATAEAASDISGADTLTVEDIFGPEEVSAADASAADESFLEDVSAFTEGAGNAAEVSAAQDSGWDLENEFVDLADIERDSFSGTEEIKEPETLPVNVKENSKVISSTTVSVGEIPIDINNTPEVLADNTPLGDLYGSNLPGQAIMNNPGTMSKNKGKSSGAPVALGIVGGFLVLAMIGIIGFFAAKFLNAPKEATPQPITDDTVPTSSDNGVSDQNTLAVDKNNVMNMDNKSNALASTAGSSVEAARKSGKATVFVDVKKLTWEVPDYVSYDANFRQFFQSAGKSLKLGLVSDLLLAKDLIYSSPVKVSVTFTKDGTFKTSQIINSSGSTQIDSIVLQTVNQTLKSLKAPHSVRNDESTTAILKIYF